jgi:hypothetical protein
MGIGEDGGWGELAAEGRISPACMESSGVGEVTGAGLPLGGGLRAEEAAAAAVGAPPDEDIALRVERKDIVDNSELGTERTALLQR